MKNYALVIAGGIGQRTGQDIPKQFINVYDKPIIIYTLQAFQNHPNIDGIEVVCLEGWYDILRAYCKQFGITKLENIVNGGSVGQESIRNGLYDLASRHNDPDDVVLIHDAIRPMVSADIISDNIRVCRQYGNAITVIPCPSAMLRTSDSFTSTEVIPRDDLKNTQTPQTFFLNEIASVHKEALEKGITNSVASCTLYIETGRKVYMAYGSEKNLKITTSEDIEIFMAYLHIKRPDWLHNN